jgi:hypothetical protein
MKNRFRICAVILFTVFAISACNKPQGIEFRSNGKVDYPLTAEDEAMLDSIQHKTLLFFLNEHHPEWGIV